MTAMLNYDSHAPEITPGYKRSCSDLPVVLLLLLLTDILPI